MRINCTDQSKVNEQESEDEECIDAVYDRVVSCNKIGSPTAGKHLDAVIKMIFYFIIML